MKIGAIGIRTKIIVGDAATWYLVKKYIDGKVGGGIEDVPEELKKYVRVLGSWVDVTEDLASIEKKVDKIEGSSLVPDTEIDKLSEYPEFEDLEFSHDNLTDKNSESAFQHVDTTVTKEKLDEADKVPLYDSVTGKVVLTPKSNFGSDNLIAEYTYSGNKEVVVSSVDVASSTFTSANHGFVNGTVIFPTLNWSAGTTFPLAVFVGGLNMGFYFVVNKTDNTFQLSLTSGGAPITLSTNETMDLSKWHFEDRKYINQQIVISGLNISECRVVLQGKSAIIGALYPVCPNGVITNYTFGNAYNNSFIGNSGNIFLFLECVIRVQPFISIDIQGSLVTSNTSTANAITRVNELKASMNNSQTSINSITTYVVGNQCFANGTTVKIYKL